MTGSLIDLKPGDYKLAVPPKATPKRVQGYDPASGRIRVWHSSPYDFNEFSLDHLGQGDGHSTHAYGQYFAEHPVIGGFEGRYWHQFHGRFTDAETMLGYTGGDREAAIEQGRKYLEDFDKGLIEKGHGLVAAVNKQLVRRVKAAIPVLRSGYPTDPVVYDVALQASPDQFLQFEKPLPEALWKRIEAGTRDVIQGKMDEGGIPRGSTFYRLLNKPEVVGTLPHPEITNGEERAALFMKETLGLLGARYRDQRSRKPEMPEPSRTYNYTVWDLPIIEIVGKWGGHRHSRAPLPLVKKNTNSHLPESKGESHAAVQGKLTEDHQQEYSD